MYTEKLVIFKISNVIPAVRVNTRGRASRGCIFGYKKDLKCCTFKFINEIGYFEIACVREQYWIVPVYLNCNR